MPIPELVKSYKDSNNLTYQEMADEISHQLGIEGAITHQAVHYWAKGIYKPNLTRMIVLYRNSHGPLKELALSILQELNPEEYQNPLPVQS